MMPKFGNSCTRERIELIDRFIRLFGINSIECLQADREFVGHNWLDYLNRMGIEYHIRIRENFWVETAVNFCHVLSKEDQNVQPEPSLVLV